MLNPPKNTYLVNSAWPVGHHNSYAQGSSSLPGPTALDKIHVDYIGIGQHLPETFYLANSIFLFYTQDGKNIWGSSLTSVFVLEREANKLKVLTHLKVSNLLNISKKNFHGAYSILANINGQSQYMNARGTTISAYIFSHNPPAINEIHRYQLSSVVDDERIMGLNITYDGWIIYVTNTGVVGGVSADFSSVSPTLQLPGDKTLQVHKSFSVDETGAIYIVSNQYMQRINWSSSAKKLSLIWATRYDTGTSKAKPGLLGTGSGSTPTIMGDAKHGKYIVITDAAKLMNLNIFNAETGEIISKAPVNYGDASIHRSASEQSVLVSGWRAVVVNNEYTSKIPIISGNAPMGIEQFKFNPDNNKLESTWCVNDISVPSGIPTMSRKTKVMYAIAKKQLTNNNGKHKVSCWGLAGINWTTGKVDFFIEAGKGLAYNSAYAATEIGPDKEIISGTALGVLRFYVSCS